MPFATRRRVALALGAGGLLSVLGALPAAAQASRATAPAGNATRTYRISRAGLDLGRQSMVFREAGGAVEVEIGTHVQVSVGGMQVYEFAQNQREVWRDRRLVAFHSHANDNGERHTVELSPAGGRAQLVVDGRRREVPAEVVPTSLWHPFMLKRRTLVDSLHGAMLDFRARDDGETVLQIGEKDVTARHYSLSGDLRRRLWYDAKDDRLLRLSMVARDGSEVLFDVVR